jgi:hypothetical protein
VVVIVPSALTGEVPANTPVRIGNEEANVISGGSRVLEPTEVQRIYGEDVSTPSFALVTDADSEASNATITSSDPLLVALIPGLDAIFGDE